ncbi:hypothetical protein E2986_04019 [Frieseomelitta varia]|uniref:Uncharacterized protein n=1 Tax=Frieseomelitta varia TaxID=561572 RepID=A0A833VW24_9HYME|nr:uncharacterized protein LOC122535339 [Frieseomelitta varia]KAF3422474.1 hypothetical protein E2986_04019 [Frieseomelitta varia]
MSDKLQTTAIAISSHETAVSGFQSKINSFSGGKTNNKCFKLFSSCFRTASSTESLENIVNNNIKRRCDYVVEKLVVKHVPFVLFSISENTLEDKISLQSKNNSHRNVPQSQTKLNTTYSATSKIQSLLHYSDRFDSDTTVPLHISNKCLHFDKNVSNKRNKNDTSSNYHNKIIDSTNTTNGLHPDLGEHEKAPKDSSLNISENKSLVFSEISLKGLNKNNIYQARETFKLQSFVQEAFSKKEEFKNVYSFDSNKLKNYQKIYTLAQMERTNLNNFRDCSTYKVKRPIVQSVRKIFHSSENFVKSIDTNQTNIENCKPSNRDSQHNHQFLLNQSKTLSDCIVNIDSSNMLLRWNIIIVIKRNKSKTCPSQILKKHFNTS